MKLSEQVNQAIGEFVNALPPLVDQKSIRAKLEALARAVIAQAEQRARGLIEP